MGKKKTQRAINHWLATGENNLLLDELPFMRRKWVELSKEENDYRPGNETYGYGTDGDIRGTMKYISDRWFCAFRIKWIIDGLSAERI